MNLERLRAHWEAWGRQDPFWAVLTDPDKRGTRWDADVFFATGVTEIESIVSELREICPAMRTQVALDFGCGVGRLTQGLARHFDQVVGVDIAASMIASARSWNRHGERCRYVLNTSGDLGAFPGPSVDLVLSLITLQHMEPRYAKTYIAEFVRVVAPGGILYFQLPSGKVPLPDDAAWFRRIKARLRAATPDGLVRLYDDVKDVVAGDKPRMEGPGISRAEVVAIVEGAGATVVRVRDDHSAGPHWISHRYCAVKLAADV